MDKLDREALKDLRADARFAEKQAKNGPYYPDRGITADSLRAYAAHCRKQAEQYAKGGAHNAVFKRFRIGAQS